jgi:PPM family protein phosphatase
VNNRKKKQLGAQQLGAQLEPQPPKDSGQTTPTDDLETINSSLTPEGTAVDNGEAKTELTAVEDQTSAEVVMTPEPEAPEQALSADSASNTEQENPDPEPNSSQAAETMPDLNPEVMTGALLEPHFEDLPDPLAKSDFDTLDTPHSSETEDGVFIPDDEGPPPSRLTIKEPATDAGYLEDEVLLSEDDATTSSSNQTLSDASSIHLERGEYKILDHDAFGRTFATSPDGSEVMIVSYKSGAELTRTLYPHPMLPGLIDTVQQDGTTLIAHPKPEGRTLESAILEADKRASVSAIVDLARFNRYVFARGFSLTGLDPRDILLSPTRLLRLPKVQRIGDTPPAEAPRYGAPERAAGLSVNGTEGVFSLGALLYHTLMGRALSEGELVQDFPTTPGAPQVFTNMLAGPDTRAAPGEALDLVTRLNQNFEARASWQIGLASSVGLNPDRSVNEDAAGYRNVLQLGDAGRGGLLLACVSDGMGGMAKGEAASQAAVHAFLEFDMLEASIPIAKNATIEANRKVLEALEGKSGGCTFTGVIADGNRVVLSHVGDTRAYLIRASRAEPVQQISDDHSMVAMLVKMGVITPEAAHNHPDSNKVMRALGSARDMGAEYVDAHELDMQPGDRLILVTDGVWGAYLPAEFEQALQSETSSQDLADHLVRQALENGSSDNATAMVLEYQERNPL